MPLDNLFTILNKFFNTFAHLGSSRVNIDYVSIRLLRDQVLLIGTGNGILVNLVSMMGRDFQSHTWDGTGTLVT